MLSAEASGGSVYGATRETTPFPSEIPLLLHFQVMLIAKPSSSLVLAAPAVVAQEVTSPLRHVSTPSTTR